jgi:hypothetical protein
VRLGTSWRSVGISPKKRCHARPLGVDPTDRCSERPVASLDGFGISREDAVDLRSRGAPARAAERFAAYADVGVTWLFLGTIGDDWHAQWKLIAEAATLLD